MSLADLLHVLRRRWPAILALTIIGGAIATAVTLVTVPKYTASTQLFVSVQSTDASSALDIGQGGSAAQQKLKSYSQVATSSEVLDPVIAALHLPSTRQQLAGQITVTTPPASQILVVSVSDIDPARAARIANTVSKSFSDVVVGKLEAPIGGGKALVRIETIQPATTPTSASSPQKVPNLALGLLLGLAAGLGLAVLRDLLDTKVRTEADVREATDLSLVGSVAFDPTAAKRPLVVHLDPRSPRAEAFRSLRTNLQFVDVGRRARRFLLSSAMPSEGKTTTVANLAITIAEGGARVLVIDADLRRPRLAEVMGVEGAVGLTDVLIGQAELEDVVQPWGSAGLELLPSGTIPPNPSELLGSTAMRTLLDTADGVYDYVIVDTPPLLPVTDAAVLSTMTDGVLLVAAAGRTRRPQLARAVTTLAGIESRVLGVILTMVPQRRSGGYGQGRYYATDEANTPASPTGSVVETVPLDTVVLQSTRSRREHGRRRRAAV
jgi:succinoglycan biosynthesis transport protein ExoP